jgi:hypothetical protein
MHVSCILTGEHVKQLLRQYNLPLLNLNSLMFCYTKRYTFAECVMAFESIFQAFTFPFLCVSSESFLYLITIFVAMSVILYLLLYSTCNYVFHVCDEDGRSPNPDLP